VNASDDFTRAGWDAAPSEDRYVVKCGETYFTACAERFSPDRKDAYVFDCVTPLTGRTPKEHAAYQAELEARYYGRKCRVVRLIKRPKLRIGDRVLVPWAGEGAWVVGEAFVEVQQIDKRGQAQRTMARPSECTVIE
jgi:hypothetical protein